MEKLETKWVDTILDALECAREALSLLPPLPSDIKPVYFRILNIVYKIGGESGGLRISDISKVSGLLLPNTTKVINEMVELNLVEKFTSDADRRVVLVRATELGKQYIQNYTLPVMEDLEREFSKIDQIDCLIMIDTMHKVYQAMKTVYSE